ncbi:MAG: helix-turn-helix domain-containing protein [Bacilli bacterium]
MDFSRLAMIREKKELSQREVAKILHVGKSTYARWETGEQVIPLIHLNDFCKYFKVTMDYVLKLNDQNSFNSNLYNKEINKIIIGKNIKSIRKKYQLTQKELSKVINTSQSTISSYEKGKTLVLTVFIYNLALNFNLSVDKICDRNKELVKI